VVIITSTNKSHPKPAIRSFDTFTLMEPISDVATIEGDGMLRLELIDVGVESVSTGARILDRIDLEFTGSCFGAIVGPSGCGKTTLVKTIAGIVDGREAGTICWRGQDLRVADFEPGECGYVPQFSNFQEELTVSEILTYSRRIKVLESDEKDVSAFVEGLLCEVGLIGLADQAAGTLSGGQRRRLALAVELCSDPILLLCDEVTSGLDSRSEREILELLRKQADERHRMVLVVTHGQRNHEIFDSITVIDRGRVAFNGSPAGAASFFGTGNLANVNDLLADAGSDHWADRFAFEKECQHLKERFAPAQDQTSRRRDSRPAKPRPSSIRQFHLVLDRRIKCLARRPGEILLHLLLILTFPAIIAVFAWNGLPEVRSLGFGLEPSLSLRHEEATEFLKAASEAGIFVSGITMFQVILLCIMGANNGSREIARERRVFELERLGGLRPSAYALSKVAFVIILCLPQSIWMGLFVHYVCGFPGDLLAKCLFLFLATVSLSVAGLAVSSLSRTSEAASLVSLYLIGLQIPFSGAVLALPEAIGPAVRPLVSSYWSWSGVVRTLENEKFYDIVVMVAPSPIAGTEVAILLLTIHICACTAVIFGGCQRRSVGSLQ
jgi:ABC-type multidrug transport system ATPase subunit